MKINFHFAGLFWVQGALKSLKLSFFFMLMEELHANMFCQITAGFSANINNFLPLNPQSALLKKSFQLVLQLQKRNLVYFGSFLLLK